MSEAGQSRELGEERHDDCIYCWRRGQRNPAFSYHRPRQSRARDTIKQDRCQDDADRDGRRCAALFGALTPDRLEGEARSLIRSVESADLLVIGTPVYRASYTGALKHLFDLVRHDALAGKPVILTATGGSHLHGLVTEHQLRPLFGFFNALSLPTAVYATEADFRDYRIVNPAISDRIERAVTEAVGLFRTRAPLRITPDIHAARLPAAVNA